jgi:DNA-binding ferritin-like protein
MFSDPSKALKAVAKTAEVKRAFDRIQTLMQNDFSASVEAEKESRIQGAYEDVVEGTLVRILKAYGRDLKKLERDVDGVKDLMRGLDLLRRGAYSALSKSSLAKVVKMSEDLASTAESLVEGLEDRTHYRMLEDLPSDLEEVAWTFSNFLREHF